MHFSIKNILMSSIFCSLCATLSSPYSFAGTKEICEVKTEDFIEKVQDIQQKAPTTKMATSDQKNLQKLQSLEKEKMFKKLLKEIDTIASNLPENLLDRDIQDPELLEAMSLMEFSSYLEQLDYGKLIYKCSKDILQQAKDEILNLASSGATTELAQPTLSKKTKDQKVSLEVAMAHKITEALCQPNTSTR